MSLHTSTRARLRAASLAGALVASGAASLAPTAAAHYEHLRISSARNHVLIGSHTIVRGSMRPKAEGREVWLEARWRGSKGWRRVAKDKTGSSGRFRTKWEPPYVGHYTVRAFLTGSDAAPRRVDHGVTAYRASEASWYGPGFYGHRTACGETLESDTLGVAHKSLPCGTPVRFYYHGHTVTAPVIDRGPYAGNREYDLTAETKARLRFGSTGVVWSAPAGYSSSR